MENKVSQLENGFNPQNEVLLKVHDVSFWFALRTARIINRNERKNEGKNEEYVHEKHWPQIVECSVGLIQNSSTPKQVAKSINSLEMKKKIHIVLNEHTL